MQNPNEELHELRVAIFGNGHPGLKSDMRLLENRMDGVESTSRDNNQRLIRIERVIYAATGAMFLMELLLRLKGK